MMEVSYGVINFFNIKIITAFIVLISYNCNSNKGRYSQKYNSKSTTQKLAFNTRKYLKRSYFGKKTKGDKYMWKFIEIGIKK